MKISCSLLLIFLLLNATSCASIFSGTTETIYVKSEVPGTKLYLNKEFIGTDEATVKISKKRLRTSRLFARKDSCREMSVEIETKFDSLTLLGLPIDLGIVSILIVDWGINGAVREAKKVHFVLSPNCQT